MPRERPRRIFRNRPSHDRVIDPAVFGRNPTTPDGRPARPRPAPDACTLCSGPAAAVGVWRPTREYSDKLGAVPGKHRVVFYGLCAPCGKRPDYMAAVEDRFLAGAAAALSRPEAN
jgi:hypothetical protein